MKEFGSALIDFLLFTNPLIGVAGMSEGFVRDGGYKGFHWLWLVANVSFAGMRAQGHPSRGWRVVSFLGGFPGTLISLLVIREGSGSAYGIKLPVNGNEAPTLPESKSR